ncbi:hypothetical protein ABZY05_14455 [Streptomyces canus]|uniref:hypothetical protein n=1 Tax=Streptomyces canus TaxID=58343 RepID=UPI0033A84570
MELEELQRLRDEADIAEARAREAAPACPSMSHDEFTAQLEAEDRREAAVTYTAQAPGTSGNHRLHIGATP